MSEPVILGVERVNNPHIVPIFSALQQRTDLRFTGCILQSLPPWRVEIGWTELESSAPFLQPFRNPADRQRFLALAHDAEAVIWPGIKFPGSIRLILGRNLRRKLNVIWAERFIGRRERSRPRYIAMKGLIHLLNSSNIHLMTLGEGAEEDYRRFGATRWKVWRFGYAVEPVEPMPPRDRPAPDGLIRLAYIGALRVQKGVEVLIRALGSPRLADAPWRLRIFGEGRERPRLHALASGLGILPKIEFAGSVTHDRIADVYGQTDVLVLPSHYEGWGAVINEAMEHGVAVIGSDGAGSARLLVEHERSGLVFPAGDDETLTRHIARIIEEPGLCARLSAAGRERIQGFRPAVLAERAAALLRGLTGHAPMPDFANGVCQPIL